MSGSRGNRAWRSLRVTPSIAAGGAVVAGALGTGLLTIPCWFRAATGLDCPFCGGSRALAALLHGDLAAALDHNAFAVTVLFPLAVAVVVALGRWEAGRAATWWPAGARGRALVAVLGVLTVAWWVARAVPWPAWARA